MPFEWNLKWEVKVHVTLDSYIYIDSYLMQNTFGVKKAWPSKYE